MSASKTNGSKGQKPSDAESPTLEVSVAPSNGKVGREVVVRSGEKVFTDTINPFKASAREGFAKRVAQHFAIDNPDLMAELRDRLVEDANEADATAEQLARKAGAATDSADRSAKALADAPAEDIAAAEAFLRNPALIAELESDLENLGIAGETELGLTLYLIGTSRKLDKPLGSSVKSSSASGKSFVVENVTSLMPPEDVLQATSITPNALYYMAPGSLKHLLVVVGERTHANPGDQAEAANATTALREMLSRGRLDKLLPVKSDDGGMRTQQITQEGPIAYIDTTTQQEIFEEDATRMLSLATDESPQQTEAILRIQAQQAAWAATTVDEQEAIRRKHQTAQRMLNRLKVRIPYAEHLTLPTTKLVARRAFPQLLAFIEAVALLRQKQKKPRDGKHVYATPVDYDIAYRLMLPVLRRAFAPVGERPKKLLAAIRANALLSQTFKRVDCVEWAGVGLTEVRNRIAVLVEAGLVEQVGGSKGLTCTYRVVSATAQAAKQNILLTPAALRKRLEEAKTEGAGPS